MPAARHGKVEDQRIPGSSQVGRTAQLRTRQRAAGAARDAALLPHLDTKRVGIKLTDMSDEDGIGLRSRAAPLRRMDATAVENLPGVGKRRRYRAGRPTTSSSQRRYAAAFGSFRGFHRGPLR